MSCVPIGPDLRRLLDDLAANDRLERSSLDPTELATAETYGWVYRHQGWVALTGAGVYHAGKISRGGMLGA